MRSHAFLSPSKIKKNPSYSDRDSLTHFFPNTALPRVGKAKLETAGTIIHLLRKIDEAAVQSIHGDPRRCAYALPGHAEQVFRAEAAQHLPKSVARCTMGRE